MTPQQAQLPAWGGGWARGTASLRAGGGATTSLRAVGGATASWLALQLFKLLRVLVFVKVWVCPRQSRMGSVADTLSSLEPFWILGSPRKGSAGEQLLLRSGKFPSFSGGKHVHF